MARSAFMVLASLLILSASESKAQNSIDPATFNLTTFKCPNWLPSEEVYNRVVAREKLTVAVVSNGQQHKPFSNMCVPDGHHGCDSIIQRLNYSFRKIQFLQNGQGIKSRSHFAVYYEFGIKNPEESWGIRLDSSKRYLIISAGQGDEPGVFLLHAACELPKAQN